jgi:N-acetyl-anhydromuramoyl-L-alanine amidase
VSRERKAVGPATLTGRGRWQAAGWWSGARRLDSPNFGLRPPGTVVDLVVVHSISLPPGVYGGDAIERLFTNRLDWDAHPYFRQIRGAEVSAHFLIRRDGELLQFVATEARAWHAGRSHWQGRDDCNDFSVGIELEGLEGEAFEAPQYARLSGLLQALCRRHPVAAVVGHEHVAPQRKHDPGAAFDWQGLRKALQQAGRNHVQVGWPEGPPASPVTQT